MKFWQILFCECVYCPTGEEHFVEKVTGYPELCEIYRCKKCGHGKFLHEMTEKEKRKIDYGHEIIKRIEIENVKTGRIKRIIQHKKLMAGG